jgi:hypothetical protein
MDSTTHTDKKPGNGHYAAAAPTLSLLTLDQLAKLLPSALAEHFRHGQVPHSLAELNGRARGRVLFLAGWAARQPQARTMQRLLSARWFPWLGKSIHAQEGTLVASGVNHFRFLANWTAFPFIVRVEPSHLDGQSTVVLDYSHASPWPVRAMRDELRQVAPGLFLGPAFLRVGPFHRLILFFALDFNEAA